MSANKGAQYLTKIISRATHITCYTYMELNMANLTLSIDANLLKKARMIAIEKDTTVNALVREYLTELVERESSESIDIANRLRAIYERTTVPIGKITWSREDLHER